MVLRKPRGLEFDENCVSEKVPACANMAAWAVTQSQGQSGWKTHEFHGLDLTKACLASTWQQKAWKLNTGLGHYYSFRHQVVNAGFFGETSKENNCEDRGGGQTGKDC
jgi:hypothetical protein